MATPSEFQATLEEARASLKPGFDPLRMAQLMTEPDVYAYKDALAYLAADVTEQMARRDQDIRKLDGHATQAADLERENLLRWRDKAQGFKRHVELRAREVNATVKALNRARDHSMRTLAARVEELENAIREHRESHPADKPIKAAHARLWGHLNEDA